MSLARKIFRGKLAAQGEKIPPARLRDAVPLRARQPKANVPMDVMITGIDPHTGDGLLHMVWRGRKHLLVERKYLVPRALPGEIVRFRFGQVRERRYPRGDYILVPQLEVGTVSASPHEVKAPCPHFESCGGCDFLHLRYGRQLIEKQRWVQKALAAGKLDLSTLCQIRPSEPQARYAYRTQWDFSEVEGYPRLSPKGGMDDDEPPTGCLLPPPGTARVLGLVFDAFREVRAMRPGGCTVYEEKQGLGTFKAALALCTRSREREGRQLQILVSIVLAHDMVDIEGVLGPLVERLVDKAPKCLMGVVANVARSKRDVQGGRRELLLYGQRHIRQDLVVPVRGGQRRYVLEVGAGTRLCAHPRALTQIAETVLEMCGVAEDDTVWHCYCGGGELSLALGAACQHVVAIGTSAAEVSELKRNLSANAISNTTAVLANLRSPWTLKELAFHISHSQQRRLLLGTGEEQERARNYVLRTFVPGESRRRQLQRLSATTFTSPLLREDALAHRELKALLPAFVRDFRPSQTTLPVPVSQATGEAEAGSMEVPPEMEARLKRLYRRQALRCHPDKNPDDPEAAERFRALTRAYRALVGDRAGPEEGDENAQDPFMTAMSSNYRLKFKHRWRQGSGTGAGAREPGLRVASEELAEASQEAGGDEEEGEDEDFAVKLEIDDSWAQRREEPVPPPEEAPPRPVEEVQFTGASLAKGDDPMPMPTLPPPDVVVVSQPRNRKPGRGTPKHFLTWLRSAAPRSIVYVALDVKAFQADCNALQELGYELKRVQPFDTEPHQHSLLLVAQLQLVLPLKGSEEYLPDRQASMLPGPSPLLPPGSPVPLLGSGGYTEARQVKA